MKAKTQMIKQPTNRISMICWATLTATALISFNSTAEVRDTIERTIEFNDDGRIQLSNVNGDVTISACDCDQITLSAEIIASTQALRDRIRIEIDSSNSNLSVRTKYDKENRGSSNNGHSEVIYDLSVPNSVRLNDIDLVNGDLKIKGVTGELDADLVNGQLDSDGLTASTRVDMVNGDMDIRFDELSNAKYIDLQSVNGAINLYLPATVNATVDAETVSGKISNDFGLNVVKHKYVGSDMRGTIGSGDVKIDLENVNGRISVKRL